MSIRSEIRGMVNDWYKYMNTSIPKGADGNIYTHNMYSNRDRMYKLQEKYPEIDSRVVETEALSEYFKKNTDEEIRNKLGIYYGWIMWSDTDEVPQGNGRTS